MQTIAAKIARVTCSSFSFPQLHSAQSELRRIFVVSPPPVRMQILEQNRKLMQEKQARNANKVKVTYQSLVFAVGNRRESFELIICLEEEEEFIYVQLIYLQKY